MKRAGPVYQASRFTKGNGWFPDRIRLEAEAVVFEKRHLIGHEEESVRYQQIASVSIQRGLFFADLLFETTGGSAPVFLNGLWGSSAEAAKRELQLRLRRKSGGRDDEVLALLKEQNTLLKAILDRLERAN
jgi:hypothetical protein